MKIRHPIVLLLLGLLPAFGAAANLSTAQRLELLERRVSRVTDLTLQLDEMRRENRQLRGRIEQLGHEVEQLKRKQRDIYLDVDQRLSKLQQGGAAISNTVSPAAAAAATAPDPEVPVVGAKPATRKPASNARRAQIQDEYQAAYALISPQQRRYDEAAAAFTDFLEKYPGDVLAPNAQYWLGEAHYVTGKNEAALTAFEQVVAQYPDSTKAPGALFKIGRLHQSAGRASAAREAYQRVLNDYPESPAVSLARQRLKQVGG